MATVDPNLCVLCEEPKLAGEDLFEDGAGQVHHRACFFRLATGSLAHQLKVCTCYEPLSTVPHQPAWMTWRQAAEEALKFFLGQHELTADQLRAMLTERGIEHGEGHRHQLDNAHLQPLVGLHGGFAWM